MVNQTSSNNQSSLVTVLPGDDLTYIKEQGEVSSSESKKQVKLGTGLSYDPSTNKISATLAGRLVHKSTTGANTYYILTNSKRYIPAMNDRVLCIVEDRIGDYYRVTLPASSTGSALLNTCSFEGATKRNRPNLKNGDLLYARISICNTLMEPEVSCMVLPGEGNDSAGASRKDWMTNEGTYGQLKGGSCLQISIGLAQELLKPTSVVLEALGNAKIPFEICIGINGIIWVDSERPEYTILILNAIQNSEVMSEEQIRGMVKSLVHTVRSTYLEE
jgi:exosome complex component RRP40